MSSKLNKFQVAPFVTAAAQLEQFKDALAAADEKLVIAALEYMLQAHTSYADLDDIYQEAMRAMAHALPNTESANMMVALAAARPLFAEILESTQANPGVETVPLLVSIILEWEQYNERRTTMARYVRIDWIQKVVSPETIKDGLRETFNNSIYTFRFRDSSTNGLSFYLPGDGVLSVEEVTALVSEVLSGQGYDFQIRFPAVIHAADDELFEEKVDERLGTTPAAE